MTSPTPASPRLQAARALCLALLVALVALGLVWEMWLAPFGRGTLALKVVPLLFALPGLARHRLYTYRWLSLLVWLYFMEGVLRVTVDTGLSRTLAGTEIALSLALFAACAFYIRGRLRNRPAGPTPDQGT